MKLEEGAVIRNPGNTIENDMSGWRTSMPVKDTKKCTKCGLCWLYCPDGAIFKDNKKGEIKINYKHCKGCGICAKECPFGAIKMIEEKK